MLWLNPDHVTLGSDQLDQVSSITVDRAPRKTALEWTDLGPHLAFADVPEQRIDIRITRTLADSESISLTPGDQVTLIARRAAGASAAKVERMSASVVIMSIEHTLSRTRGATQRIHALAISSDGAADPISLQTQMSET